MRMNPHIYRCRPGLVFGAGVLLAVLAGRVSAFYPLLAVGYAAVGFLLLLWGVVRWSKQ